MNLPNLLASPKGRLSAFFLLYITEGIPLGFAVTAVATQLRRMGVGPEAIGAFVAAFYLPWAFKWAFGPFVDVVRSRRWGHRRGWILWMQLLMAASLFSLVWVPLPQGLALFTGILLLHNTFGAIQDVAIDALAVNSLSEQERGLGNGLMFAGAMLGQAIGGSGVLFAMGYTGFQGSFVIVALAILAVTTLVVLPMKEAVISAAGAGASAGAAGAAGTAGTGGGMAAARAEMRAFAVQAFRSFLGSRGAYAGVFFALLPAGAISLGLALQSNLAVELGMTDDAIAFQTLCATLVSGAFMVLGGLLSDRLGRRRTLAIYIALMSLPVLYLMWVLQQAGYIAARPAGSPAQPALIAHFWVATLTYNVFMGLMYGTRSAVLMDITNPKVAGTQFTAYMAMMNLCIAFAATWQGVAIEKLGYPLTLLIDALTGVVCLLLLPWMRKPASQAEMLGDAHAAQRARITAAVLALLCLSWLPYQHLHDPRGSYASLVSTGYTLVFVASALFLYASSLLQGHAALGLAPSRQAASGETASSGAAVAPSRWLNRLTMGLAVGLLALYARKFTDTFAAWGLPEPLLKALPYAWDAIALGAGLLLLALARRRWDALKAEPAH